MSRKVTDHSTSRVEPWNRRKLSERQKFVDASARSTSRSDRAFVLGRLLTLAIVYTLMARSITVHQTPGGYLMLPFAVELLTVQWVGWFLARFVVDCDGFKNEMGRINLPLGWTLFVTAVTVIAVVWSGDFQPDTSRLWTELVGSRLVWIVVADWIALTGSPPEDRSPANAPNETARSFRAPIVRSGQTPECPALFRETGHERDAFSATRGVEIGLGAL